MLPKGGLGAQHQLGIPSTVGFSTGHHLVLSDCHDVQVRQQLTLLDAYSSIFNIQSSIDEDTTM